MSTNHPFTPSVDRATFDPTTPQAWESLRALGHRMLDDLIDAQQGLHASPVWQQVPRAVQTEFETSGPRDGVGADAAYERFLTQVLPYGLGNWHPRFFGWVQGNGTPLAMLADMLAAGMNPHLGGFNQAPAMIERQVVRWFGEWLGFPEASGLFVTGGTMANVHALACARITMARRLGRDARRDGAQAWPGEPVPSPFVFYGSSETHGWAHKAAEWLGLGDRAFRAVPVDADYRVRLDALQEMIETDRAAGLLPFCVMGTAGTVNTGATDDLATLAELCAREQLWFHVDGAFGALAALSPLVRDQVVGMDRADSVAFDLHKWGSMPFECACVLVRDAAAHHLAFRNSATYLAPGERGPTAGGMYFNERGLDLTRGFKALKVWMQLHADGVSHFGRVITQNVLQVRQLVARIDAEPDLERLAPAPLNIVCFRYRPAAIKTDEEALNTLNRELLARLQESGVALPSSTMLGSRFAIRVAHVNHRTRDEDIAILVDTVLDIGRHLHRPAS
ncbi:pyridoxal phosphate-dependent decarboxylase family protein [Gemmatimonas sp.]|jgi:glutamate/tyrosine decarboxylase-like PLP-dependent enzyme|uniref:pyridoxal phosphate-dependent decarboxylase family protein n=1 Tax=Gemmatimonas sp. TaxID=1962908 RepID=UPI0037C0FC05